MKKISLLVFLFISANAMAAWTEMTDTHSDEGTVYIDVSKIRNRGGEKVKMRHIINYKSPQTAENGKAYLSRKELVEYSCEEEHYRLLGSSTHTGLLGKGRVVEFSSEAKQWQPVEIDTLAESLWKVACDKPGISQHD